MGKGLILCLLLSLNKIKCFCNGFRLPVSNVCYDLLCSTCSPSPAASAWVLVHHLCHRSVSPCHHIPWWYDLLCLWENNCTKRKTLEQKQSKIRDIGKNKHGKRRNTNPTRLESQCGMKPHFHVGYTNVPPASYLPLRANSIDLIAVVLLVPVVTLNEATRSWVSVFNTKICNKQNIIELFELHIRYETK